MININAPFPQADDITKVLAIVNIDREEDLQNNAAVLRCIGVTTDRQVAYYMAACRYLGLVENKAFTNDGKFLRSLYGMDQNIELARLVCMDKVFGTVYFRQRMTGRELETDDIIRIMRQHVQFNSDEMYNRRAQTVASWVKWIYDHEWAEVF